MSENKKGGGEEGGGRGSSDQTIIVVEGKTLVQSQSGWSKVTHAPLSRSECGVPAAR